MRGRKRGNGPRPSPIEVFVKISCIISLSLCGCSERSKYLYVRYILCIVVGSVRERRPCGLHQIASCTPPESKHFRKSLFETFLLRHFKFLFSFLFCLSFHSAHAPYSTQPHIMYKYSVLVWVEGDPINFHDLSIFQSVEHEQERFKRASMARSRYFHLL